MRISPQVKCAFCPQPEVAGEAALPRCHLHRVRSFPACSPASPSAPLPRWASTRWSIAYSGTSASKLASAASPVAGHPRSSRLAPGCPPRGANSRFPPSSASSPSSRTGRARLWSWRRTTVATLMGRPSFATSRKAQVWPVCLLDNSPPTLPGWPSQPWPTTWPAGKWTSACPSTCQPGPLPVGRTSPCSPSPGDAPPPLVMRPCDSVGPGSIFFSTPWARPAPPPERPLPHTTRAPTPVSACPESPWCAPLRAVLGPCHLPPQSRPCSHCPDSRYPASNSWPALPRRFAPSQWVEATVRAVQWGSPRLDPAVGTHIHWKSPPREMQAPRSR